MAQLKDIQNMFKIFTQYKVVCEHCTNLVAKVNENMLKSTHSFLKNKKFFGGKFWGKTQHMAQFKGC